MSSIILTPIGDGTTTALTVVPAGRDNWECVNDYPRSLELESYVYTENGTEQDMYEMSNIQALQRIEVATVRVGGFCERENATQACTAEVQILPVGGAIIRGAAEVLTEAFGEYTNSWNVNPRADLFWTIAEVNLLEAGVRLMSGGAGCEAQCTQLYVDLTVNILGEFVSNYSPFYKDTIHVNQGYSVVAQEDHGRALFGATTVRISYKDPDGVTGTISGDIMDSNRIIAPVTALLNNKTGKWWFKLDVVLAGGEILEGVPFFVNIQPEWF